MAMVREKRITPPYAVIAFAFLWVVATTFAVIFYVQWGKAEHARTVARQRLEEFASAQDRTNPVVQVLLNQATRENTVVEQLLATVHELVFRIEGTAAANTLAPGGAGAVILPSVATKVTGASGVVVRNLAAAGLPDESLVGAIQKLKGQADVAAGKAAAARKALASYERRFSAAHRSFARDLGAAQSKLRAAQQRINALSASVTHAQQKLENQASALQNQVSTLQQKYVSMLRGKVVLLQQIQQELAAQKSLVGTLREQLVELRPPTQGAKAILARADGRILSIAGVSHYVYINLGSIAHVITGLSFAVYQPSLGVGSGPHGGGKGSIVVTQVGPYVSLARITHVVAGEQLYPGDLIANPVYHRSLTHKYRFYVYGNFNVNGNGVATAHGRRQIVRMIRQWGGVIDKSLNSQTDFLVLGSPPSNGSLNFGAALTPQNRALAALRQGQQNVYQQLQKQAASLSVPILDANRFLAMVGYYSHPLVRQ